MVENRKKYINQLRKMLQAFKSRNEQLSEEIKKNEEAIQKMEDELSKLSLSSNESTI